jgi:hypothetical protein
MGMMDGGWFSSFIDGTMAYQHVAKNDTGLLMLGYILTHFLEET